MTSDASSTTPHWSITHVDGLEVTHKRDQKNSITSALGLTRYGDRLAGVVESPKAKDQISALLDLIDLQQSGAEDSPAGVALLLAFPTSEAIGALEALRDVVSTEVPVAILRLDHGSWTPVERADFDLTTEDPHYKGWPKLLGARFETPSLVEQFLDAVQTPKLRVYPQLSAVGEWSIRLEGLQVGRVLGNNSGFLDVGRLGKVTTPGQPGNQSAERKTWLEVHPHGRLDFNEKTLDLAAAKVQSFAQKWHAKVGDKATEHALESRILRGDVPVVVERRSLGLIKADPGVNWGSQFPTKWGPGGRARYLDALLRDPGEQDVPWAVEMKVGLGGEGQYYRHAVAQAVLYRYFIRNATGLRFWFDHYDLDATKCKAVVVVPEFKTAHWESRLTRLCDLFGVRLATVPDAATLP